MRRRRLYGELLPVYLLAGFAVMQAVAQALDDWPVALQLVALGVFVVVVEHINEARRVLAYQNGYTRGAVVGLDAARDRLDGIPIRPNVPLPSAVHPDDGWRP